MDSIEGIIVTYTVIIPARFASTRLPGKPLAELAGRPMVEHVWQRALASTAQRVIIATDDQRVFEVCQDFGAEVCMTRTEHESGTDRLAEVVELMQLPSDAVVVNVQGDEPLIPAAVIEQVAANLKNTPAAGMATLCERITHPADVLNPNVVKVVFNAQHQALYFSRSVIPFPRDTEVTDAVVARSDWYRHLGIYAYRVSTLRAFTAWPMANLEALEKLEQLRALYQGIQIHVEPACAEVPGGVDTPEDLAYVSALLGG